MTTPGTASASCRAKRLLLITTRGGNFSLPETAWMESGARHLQALCAMYGIPDFQLLCAEGLDDVRNDKARPAGRGHGAGGGAGAQLLTGRQCLHSG